MAHRMKNLYRYLLKFAPPVDLLPALNNLYDSRKNPILQCLETNSTSSSFQMPRVTLHIKIA